MEDLAQRLRESVGDRYRVERELGSGAMGVVFLAEDLKLERRVAIKVLRPEIAQSVGEGRFLREIRISARLSHPNILSLIDSGAEAGLLYYVMYYVEGETLKDRLKRESRLPVDEAVRLAREIAEALGHAHRHGVVHRDVKPGNILLDQGHALVCDFGIARAIGEIGGETLTVTGFAVGTPVYMSPEQATGDTTVDERADVYALGCVLYEMLMGSPPFTGGLPQVIVARKYTEPVPELRGVRPELPRHVERAVMTALDPNPTTRFPSADAFAAALEDPKAAARSARRGWWAGRARRYGWWAAGVVALLAVAAAVALMSRGGPTGPLRVRSDKVTALSGFESSPGISPDGRWMVYAGDGDGDRDIFLQSLAGERPINLTEDSPADDYAPAFSPDGSQIAFRSERDDGGLYVMGQTGEAVRRVSDRGHNPAWSPDGGELAYSLEYVQFDPLNVEPERSGLWTLDLASGQDRELLATDAVLPAWSPDGRWVAYTHRSEETLASLWLVPARGGEPARMTDDGGNDWGCTWSPDGRYLYFTSDRGGSMNLWRLPVDSEHGRAAGALEPIPTPSPFAAHPSISPDGTGILYVNVLTTQNIERAELDPRTDTLLDPVPLTTGTRRWSSPDPSPDGSRAVFYTRDQPEGDLYIVNRDGTGLRQLTGDSAIDRLPHWSPDGSLVAYSSDRGGGLETWVIRADGSGERQLTFNAMINSPGAWSPDGSRLAIDVTGGDAFLMDADRTTDEQTIEPLVHDSAWGSLIVDDWSRDGTRLAAMHGWADQGVGYYDLTTGECVPLTDFGQWPVWLPDSRRILFVSGRKAFYIVDAETRSVRRIYSTVRDILGPPRLTADGREVVYSRRVTEGDLWMATLEGEGLRSGSGR
ncbi:MAG: serine/threonine-protein kinase [Gemmatimonadetes bacterium]|nr:serine/threonine-protein kinase [Gemmatimonadota bacterium]